MKIHSLSLIAQDMPDKEGKLFAVVSGKLTIDTGEVKKDEKGEPVLDKEKAVIPIFEDINFMIPLNSSKELKTVVQSLAMEALTLKAMEIAKKNGQLSHYVESVKGFAPDEKPKKDGPAPIPVPRRRIKRK